MPMLSETSGMPYASPIRRLDAIRKDGNGSEVGRISFHKREAAVRFF